MTGYEQSLDVGALYALLSAPKGGCVRRWFTIFRDASGRSTAFKL